MTAATKKALVRVNEILRQAGWAEESASLPAADPDGGHREVFLAAAARREPLAETARRLGVDPDQAWRLLVDAYARAVGPARAGG